MVMFNNLLAKFLKILTIGSHEPVGASCNIPLIVMSHNKGLRLSHQEL